MNNSCADKICFPGTKSDWNSFDRFDFELDGVPCIVVRPETAAAGLPWIWRARFFGAFPFVDLAILKLGWHLVYTDVVELYGSPEAMRRYDRFYHFLTTEYAFPKRPVLEGYSRGGLPVYAWAARNPDKVACIYADAPVCDFKSWPGGKGTGPGSAECWNTVLKVYGLSETEAMIYTGNPIDNLEPLAAAGIPLIHVVGDIDEVVPVKENTAILETRYKKLNGTIEVIHKPDCAHHPHCLENPQPVVEFILNHYSIRKA
jgi:pimeloyl-ACP methyl ester carboxylesterase